MKSAKELCARYITRQITELDEEEKDDIYYYLDDRGYEVTTETKPRQLCMMLMEDLIKKEGAGRIPITAYSHKIIQDLDRAREVRARKYAEAEEKAQRRRKIMELERSSSVLPGCVKDRSGIVPNVPYSFILDPAVGLIRDSEGQEVYKSLVNVPENIYMQIFTRGIDKPVLELSTPRGKKTYARIAGPHSGINNMLLLNFLTQEELGLREGDKIFMKLCVDMPEITSIMFTYYGTQEELNEILPELIVKLPKNINTMTSLKLGDEIHVDNRYTVRIDKLYSEGGEEVFSGIFPLGYSNVPFEIEPEK